MPKSLGALAYRNAAEVRSGRDLWNHIDRLLKGIEALLTQQAPASRPEPEPKKKAPTPQTSQKAKQAKKAKPRKPSRLYAKTLELMLVPELKAMAENMGIPVKSSWRKQDLIDHILNAPAEVQEPVVEKAPAPRESTPKPSKPTTSAAPSGRFAVIGDETTDDLAKFLESKNFRVLRNLDDRVHVLVVALSGAYGVMPVHRELFESMAARYPYMPICIVLTDTRLMDDEELLELVEIDARSVLDEYGLKGDDAFVGRFPMEADALVQHLVNIPAG